MEEFDEINKSMKKIKILKLTLLIITLLTLIVGTSYANWQFNFISALQNKITTENISLEFLESSGEIIQKK